MRICIDLTSLADNFSGIERYAACLALEMIKSSNDEFILIFKEKEHEIFKEQLKRSNVESLVLKRCNKLLFNQVRLPFSLYKVKADIFLFMAFPVPILLFKKNMVSTIHDICCWDCPETMNGMSKWYFRISHRVAVKKCRAIITISEFSKKRINEKLHIPLEKIWMIYCGISEQFCAENVRNIDFICEKYNIPNKYYLSLSTLEPRKNLKLLISAYRELILEGHDIPDLVLAGRRGWKMNEVFSSMEDDVKSRIHFTGFIDDEDLVSVYGNATCFIFPSMYEGFGMPPLEAMSCGVPVISSDAASLPEVCGNAAIYFKSDDIESLKKAIIEYSSITVDRRKNLMGHIFEQSCKYKWSQEAEKLISHLMVMQG